MMVEHLSLRLQLANVLLGAAVFATPAIAQDRGELLYSTHCGTCHAEQIHWRARRAVSDWTSLRAEVRKWQAMASLAWSEDDVLEVSRYLNDSIYRFSIPTLTAADVPSFREFIAAGPTCRPKGSVL